MQVGVLSQSVPILTLLQVPAMPGGGDETGQGEQVPEEEDAAESAKSADWTKWGGIFRQEQHS